MKKNVLNFNKYKDIYDKYKRLPINFTDVNTDEIETTVRDIIYNNNRFISLNTVITELEEYGFYCNEHYEINEIEKIIGEYL